MSKMTKKELEKDAKKLESLMIPIFNIFTSDTRVKTKIEIERKSNSLLETVSMSLPEGLCYLRVSKSYYIKDLEKGESSNGSDDWIEIEIKWFDWDHSMLYTEIYYPHMDTDLIIQKVRILTQAAMGTAVADHSYRNKEE